jgi:glucokinase
VIVNEGPDVPPQGRIDLTKIRGRPLEESVSRRAILTRYAKLSHRALAPGEDVRDIAERAKAGEAAAHAVFDEALGFLGRALAPWLRRFGATILVVGGAMAGSWELVADPLQMGMSATDPTLPSRVRVVPGRLSEDAALVGAARHVMALIDWSKGPGGVGTRR